jgi:hypothetical protein
LIDEGWDSSVVDVKYFRGAGSCWPLFGGCKSQRLSVSKQELQHFNMERFNLKMLNDVEVKEQYEYGLENSREIMDTSVTESRSV